MSSCTEKLNIMKISPHVSYSEVIYSQTAMRNDIDNEPTAAQLIRIKLFADMLFEP